MARRCAGVMAHRRMNAALIVQFACRAFFGYVPPMKNVTIYGIKNCDTMKKAFAWLDKHKVAYEFHDYKKSGADKAVLEQAFREHGWEKVLNRAGMTWRKLPDKVKADMNAKTALATALDNPSVIKRPLVVTGKDIHLGFDEAVYSKLFGVK
jgi:arsenate reductase